MRLARLLLAVLGLGLVLAASVLACATAKRDRTPPQGGNVEPDPVQTWTDCLAAGRGEQCAK